MHAEILRNIIYSGVWTKYEYTRLKKKRELEKEETKGGAHS